MAQTEASTMAARSFRKAGSPRPHLPTCSAAYDGNLVCHGAEDVEQQVIDYEYGPGANGQDAEEELEGI